MPGLAAWGRFVYRRRWLVLFVALLAVAASIASLLAGGALRNVEFSDTESGRASQLLRDELPQPTGAPPAATSSFILIFTSKDGLDATDPRFVAAMNAALDPLRAHSRGISVVTPHARTAPQGG